MFDKVASGELYEADALDHRGLQHTRGGGAEDDWQGARSLLFQTLWIVKGLVPT